MSYWGQDRAHLEIPIYNLFVLEYSIDMPVPELGKGKHIYMAISDDVVVTERGMEYPNPPFNEIQVIR